MKQIRRLSEPTQGLAAYVEECAHGHASWEGFRNDAGGASYRELVERLRILQRGLCGYCEIDLFETDRQVEHVIPQSDPIQGISEELNHDNLIACCRGGAAKSLYGPDAADDEMRFLAPAKRNISCGQAKGDTIDAALVDPRSLPPVPAIVKVYPDGRMDADQDTCERSGVRAEAVNRTIEILGLNVERLRRARESRWRALNQNWNAYFENPEVLESAVHAELFPDSDGHLPRFFTTSRSYFGPFAEGILQHHSDRWV